MTLKFWGVRGSIPTATPQTVRYGGNTPCIEVRCGNELIILDAGSGIRELGNHLMGELLGKGPLKASILFSHLHWDHLQGLPFFVPAYLSGNEFKLIAQARNGLSLEQALSGQMTYPYFPVSLHDMASHFQFDQFEMGQSFQIGAVRVTTFPTRHPQNGTAYRLEFEGKSVLYATDTEHHHTGEIDTELLKAAQGVDLLIYDATYTNTEYAGNGKPGSSKVGWGHSTWEEGVRLAKEAGAKKLILFHHDPSRTDRQLDVLERKAQSKFRSTKAAREGMVLKI